MTAAHSYPPPSTALWRSDNLRGAVDIDLFFRSVSSVVSQHARPAAEQAHGVLVIPGLLAGDGSTSSLRWVLDSVGHTTGGWGMGPNIGPTDRIVAGVFEALDRLYERTGEPVSVIGQSLGGFFARELARLVPEKVRSVITLGTPLRMRQEDDHRGSRVGWVYDSFRPWHGHFFDGVPRERDLKPFTMPSTSIYSRYDGVVSWRSCLQDDHPHSENVHVACSHVGMAFHPRVLRVVLDRLELPVGSWRPFEEASAAVPAG